MCTAAHNRVRVGSKVSADKDGDGHKCLGNNFMPATVDAEMQQPLPHVC